MSDKFDFILDVDPGHDDAFLLIYSLFSQHGNCVGVSTVGGNQSLDKTTINTLNILNLFTNENVYDPTNTKDIQNIDFINLPVAKGSEYPLMGQLTLCPEIHGESGLDTTDKSFVWPTLRNKAIENIHSMEYFAKYILEHYENSDKKVHIIATGRLTNIALLLSMYPQVIKCIATIEIMGGAFRSGGNTHPTAEFNIQIDPEAAQIVFNHGCSPEEMKLLQTVQTTPATTTLRKVPVVLIPLDITHEVLVTDAILDRVRAVCLDKDGKTSKFGHLLADLLTFFANTYKEVFHFRQGPPLHDPVTFFYLSAIQHNKSNNTVLHADPTILRVSNDNTSLPALVETIHTRIDVDCSLGLARGTTCVDYYNLQPNKPRNVILGLKANVDAFWDHFMDCVSRADKQCILNKQ